MCRAWGPEKKRKSAHRVDMLKCSTPENCDCRFANCAGECSSCPVRCCRRTRGPHLDVDTLDLSRSARAVELPFELEHGAILPRVSSPHPDENPFAPARLVSIRAGAKPSGHVLSTGLAAGSFDGLTGLDFFAPDQLLERLWSRGVFARNLPAELGVDFAVAPDFSIYWDDPRLEQELALKRSLHVCNAWSAAGVPMIPVLNWAREEHRQVSTEFIAAGDYRVAAFNFQMLQPAHVDRVLEEAREALLASPSIESVLICGGSNENTRETYSAALRDWVVAFTSAKWQFNRLEEN